MKLADLIIDLQYRGLRVNARSSAARAGPAPPKRRASAAKP